MIHEVQLGRSCDSLRHELEKEITYGVNAQVTAYAMIEAQKVQIAYREEAARVQTERIMNQVKASEELKKEIRRQKRLTLIVGVVGLLAIFLL